MSQSIQDKQADHDEGRFLQIDGRVKIQDYNQHPFNAMGKVVAYYETTVNGKFKVEKSFGTGTKISSRVVLTSAHLIYFKKYNTTATFIQFYPFAQKKQKNKPLKHIKVEKYCFHPDYLKKSKEKFKKYDIILLVLEQNDFLQNIGTIPMNFNYEMNENESNNVILAGYSSDLQSNQSYEDWSNNILTYQQRPPKQQEDIFLHYFHTTAEGNSGGPILIKNQDKYQIIGIHKGVTAGKNYGILINNYPNSRQILSQIIQRSQLDEELKQLYHPTYQTLLKKVKLQSQIIKKLEKQIERKDKQIKRITLEFSNENNYLNEKIQKLEEKIQQFQTEFKRESTIQSQGYKRYSTLAEFGDSAIVPEAKRQPNNHQKVGNKIPTLNRNYQRNYFSARQFEKSPTKIQINNILSKDNQPIQLNTIVRGELYKLKSNLSFMTQNKRYLVINLIQGNLIRYMSKKYYPKTPKQITPLITLNKIRILSQDQKAWHMRTELTYFVIQEPKYQIYACKHRKAAQQWVNNLKISIELSRHIHQNLQLMSSIKSKEIFIHDSELIQKSSKELNGVIFNKSTEEKNLYLSPGKVWQKQLSETKTDYEQYSPSQSAIPQIQKSQTFNNKNKQKKTQHNLNDTQTIEQRSIDEKQKEDEIQLSIEEIISYKQLQEPKCEKETFSYYKVISKLAIGDLSQVYLAKHLQTKVFYALKAMKKSRFKNQKSLKLVLQQLKILKQVNHPLIIKIHNAFQTPQYMYQVLQYCPGHTLAYHLAHQQIFPQNEAKFYIAELILAIQYLHSIDVVYIDFRPQNIVLDKEGHIKLLDFNHSKQTKNQKITDFIVNPPYVYPQVLQLKAVTKCSDIYGIGMLLYQFIVGQPPFASGYIPSLHKHIKNGKLEFPTNISDQAQDLITNLLKKNSKKRIGSNGFHFIKSHTFFSGIDWQKIAKKEIKPPARKRFQQQLHFIEVDQNIVQKPNFNDKDYTQQTKNINRVLDFNF